MTMSTRLVVGYAVIVLGMLVCLELAFYRYNRNRIHNEIQSNLLSLNSATTTQMDNWLREIDGTAIQMANNMEFLRSWAMLKKDASRENLYSVKHILNEELRKNVAIRRIAICNEDGLFCATGTTDVDSEKVERRIKALQEKYRFGESDTRVFLSPQRDFWYSKSDIEVISVIRPITDTSRQIHGFIEVEMKAKYLVDELDKINIEEYPVCCMIIWGDQQDILYTNLPEEGLENQDTFVEATRQYYDMLEIEEYLVSIGRSNYYQCRLILMIEKDYIAQEVMKFLRSTLLIVLTFLLAGIFLVYGYSKMELKSLEKLTEYMKNQQLEDFDRDIQIKAYDYETEVLVEAYQNMLVRLRDSLEQMNKLKDIQTNAVFSILQNEVSPHFLYNTLGAIAYLCEENENQEAVKACFDLSDILRYASNYATANVTVENEIHNLEAYLSIMKNRYRQRLTYHMKWDREALYALLPKLTLQPIIENAIKYSLMEMEEVVIDISIHYRDEILEMEVSDNGCGMSEEDIAEVAERLKKYSSIEAFREFCDQIQFGGMGLSGTLMRLSIFFGEKFSYDIIGHNESNGATIILRMDLKECE